MPTAARRADSRWTQATRTCRAGRVTAASSTSGRAGRALRWTSGAFPQQGARGARHPWRRRPLGRIRRRKDPVLQAGRFQRPTLLPAARRRPGTKGPGVRAGLRRRSGGVYHFACEAGPSGRPLYLLDPATGRDRLLGNLETGGGGLTVSPDGKTILYAKAVGEGSDLMLIENFRYATDPEPRRFPPEPPRVGPAAASLQARSTGCGRW